VIDEALNETRTRVATIDSHVQRSFTIPIPCVHINSVVKKKVGDLVLLQGDCPHQWGTHKPLRVWTGNVAALLNQLLDASEIAIVYRGKQGLSIFDWFLFGYAPGRPDHAEDYSRDEDFHCSPPSFCPPVPGGVVDIDMMRILPHALMVLSWLEFGQASVGT
jgi:hypothetical protein